MSANSHQALENTAERPRQSPLSINTSTYYKMIVIKDRTLYDKADVGAATRCGPNDYVALSGDVRRLRPDQASDGDSHQALGNTAELLSQSFVLLSLFTYYNMVIKDLTLYDKTNVGAATRRKPNKYVAL